MIKINMSRRRENAEKRDRIKEKEKRDCFI
jgi:hypothetical protein